MLRKLRRFVKLTVLLAGLILTMTLVAGPGFLAGKGDFVNRDSSDRRLQMTQDVQNINTSKGLQPVVPVRVSNKALLSSDGYRLAKRLSDKCVGYSRRHISNQKRGCVCVIPYRKY
ncbi:uncharacterized protein LOC128220500 [Mya arenaria]|uniref:uncharacterized protein LOC128220500 n=1 Tax=Mya arenaria TaxID=6604 RepID=UPI0022E97B79|nr:uncharacterized protein LOC128220500 [Mya arenaria]XP_052784893.1 uncharacterized protein LOC128220500 [Mya arenaria]